MSERDLPPRKSTKNGFYRAKRAIFWPKRGKNGGLCLLIRVITYLTNELQSAIIQDAVTGQEIDYILVPRKPTAEMIRAAWDAALAEDAAWVWEEMIQSYVSSVGNSDNGNR